MKIKLTEEQYRKFIFERDKKTAFMDKVYKEIQNSDIKRCFSLNC